MSDSPLDLAETFMAHWNANRVEEALARLSEDVLYDNVPYPDINGREAVRRFHLDFGMGFHLPRRLEDREHLGRWQRRPQRAG